MDCRRTVVMAVALLSGALGCSLTGKQSALPTLADASEERPQRPLSKRTPKAGTCVAMGTLKEREAEAPGRSPAEQEQLLEQARKSYQQALDAEPKNLEAALALARLYSNRGDHERAVAIYQKALKYHAKEPRPWAELGMCHARKSEWEPAVKCLRKTLELDPDNRRAAHFLGYSLVCAGRYDESLALFRKTDGEALAHYNLARMLHQLERPDLSRQHLMLALQNDPQLLVAQQMLAQLDGQAQGVVPAGHQDRIE